MKAFQTLWPRSLARITASLIAALSLLTLMTACGGSGGAASTSNGTNQSGGSTTTALEVGPVTLAGVAAMGAPMLGATISVVDAKGFLQGSTTTNAADGSYSLALPASNIPLPLLIEANGVDMTGTPISLHSVVQTATSGATRITVNVNPVTDAVVAMLLGADPAPQFKAASTQASTWTQLGNTTALTSASDLIKTIIKTNLTDAKVTNSAKLDFFQDPTFSANKTGLDGAMEGLRIQVGLDSASRPQLEFSNRFRAPGATEVTINLASANTQLALGSTGKVANAITSTAKVTTSAASLINNVATLDALSASINQLIASKFGALQIVVEPMFSTFSMHDGADVFTVANLLAQYGISGWQLSRFQFTGCADDSMPTSGCAKPMVSALVSDSTGQIMGVFNNVVKYSTSTGWTLQGNGRQSKWTITGAAWASWDAAGQITASGQGVRFNIVPLIDSLFTTLVLPSGHSISLYDCQMTLWCQTQTSTGDLISDYILQSSQLGWFGQQDATRGARYKLTALSILVPGGDISNVALPNDVPTGTATSTYPLPDGLAGTAPLTCANITAGLHVTWSAWAAANPTMRMLSVRSIVTAASQPAPWIQTATVYPLSANVTDVPAVTSPPTTPTACQLWMVAQDTQGRQFISKIVAAP